MQGLLQRGRRMFRQIAVCAVVQRRACLNRQISVAESSVCPETNRGTLFARLMLRAVDQILLFEVGSSCKRIHVMDRSAHVIAEFLSVVYIHECIPTLANCQSQSVQAHMLSIVACCISQHSLKY